MSKLLFLDDERFPIDCIEYIHTRISDVSIYEKEWFIVRTYREFADYIETNGVPDLISFDHDLADFHGSKEYTGKDCADYLAYYCLDHSRELPPYIVHSGNTVGIDNIKSVFTTFKKYIS